MHSVGQIEKKTQERVLALLGQRLGYTRLGDWIDRTANSNIEPERPNARTPERLKAWLATQGVAVMRGSAGRWNRQ
jgi:type I restriction enzyme, R subunit